MRALIPCIGLLLLLGTQGCVTVHPPEHLSDPVACYLTDYGVHSAVILPTPQNNYVEYCYGDWPFAVENWDFPPIDGPRALFLSMQSGFGRRYEKVDPINGGPIVPHSDPSLKSIKRFYAERQNVEKVLKELDDRYNGDKGPSKINEANGNVYVKDDEHYSIVHNCNHLTSHILRELNCEVDGIVVTSSFSIDDPKVDPTVTPIPAIPRDATAAAPPSPKIVSSQ